MIPGIFAGAARAVSYVVPTWIANAAASVTSKLISFWDFESSGSDLYSQNALTGTGTYGAGKVGNKVTKTSRFVNASAVAPPSMNTADGVGGISFGGWIYVAGTGGEDIEVRGTIETLRIAIRNGNQAHFVAQMLASPFTSVTISSSVGALAVGSYYLVVATYNPVNREMKLYVNGGTPVATGTAAGAVDNITNLSFGRVSGNVYTALHNDSSFMASCVLTDAEVAWLYNSASGRAGSAIPANIEGAWSWFTDPRALLLPSGRVVVGTAENDGKIALRWTDDGGATATRYQLEGAASVNDHDHPALLRRADGKLMAFYCRHNGSAFKVAISAAVDDPSSFSTTDIASSLGMGSYSYALPIQLVGETNEPIFVFFRGGTTPTWSAYFSKSTDGGTTWPAATRLLDGDPSTGRPYLKACRNGSTRIDFACTDGHPASVSTNSIRHFYYEAGGWYASDGTSIGAPPFDTATDLTTVYNGSTNRAWIHDIKIGSDGHPRVVFAVFVSTTDHRYYYGRWTGSAWVTSQICTAGTKLYAAEDYYSGGVCLDSDDPNIVYASRGQGGGRWALYKYVTSNGGTSFAETDMGIDGIRPFHIKGAEAIAALNARYVTFSNYRSRVALLGV